MFMFDKRKFLVCGNEQILIRIIVENTIKSNKKMCPPLKQKTCLTLTDLRYILKPDTQLSLRNKYGVRKNLYP